MMITMHDRPSTTTTSSSSRVLSIDVLRGITIAFMILVNDPGDWGHTYAQLDHAKWNGWTLTDLVFPSFLFLVGASIILSLSGRIARGDSRRELAGHIVRRSITIFVLAMVLNLIPYFHFTQLRLYGVLPRIALCYLCAGLICLVTRRARNLTVIAGVLLVGYWLVMRFVPVPGLGVPVRDFPLLDPYRNLVAWVDRGVMGFLQRTIHTGRLYEGTRDPEGLLSTIPAVATTLLGSLAALWLRLVGPAKEGRFTISREQCAIGLFLAGVIGIAAGLLWNIWFPINKNLWTSSYVLFAAGCSLVGLAACYWLIDIQRFHETKVGRVLTWPWLVFGSNAIVAFTVSFLLVKLLIFITFPSVLGSNGKPLNAGGWIYANLFARGNSTNLTSLAFAICFVLVCFLPNWILWRKGMFVKI
jgi:predicted acyltransferase